MSSLDDVIAATEAAPTADAAAEKVKQTTRVFDVAQKRYVARFGGTDEASGRHVFFNKLTTNQMVELEADEQGLPKGTVCSVFSLHYATVHDVCNEEEPWVLERVPLEYTADEDEDDTTSAVSFLNVIMDAQTARDVDGANPRLRKSKSIVSFKDTPHILCIVTRTK